MSKVEYKIQDLFEFIRNGANIKQGQPGGYPITRIETISTGELNRNKMGYAGITDIAQYENYILEHEDILMSHINSEKHLGKSALYEKKENERIIHGMNLLGLRVKKEILIPKYAMYLFQTQQFRKSLSKIVKKSVNQASFAVNDLKNIKVDIPSVEQQRYIVSILESCNRLIQKRQSQITALDELAQSLFLEMFGDPKTNKKNYKVKTLTEFYEHPKEAVKCGPFGSALKKEEYVISGVPVWNMDNITKQNDFIDYPNLFVTPEKANDLNNYNVKNRDIIISRAGTVGKMAVVDSKYGNSLISTNLIRLRLNEKLKPEFLVWLIKIFGDKVCRMRTGSDGSFSHMNTSVLDSIEFPYPPLEQQQEFLTRLKAIQANKNSFLDSLNEMNNLYNSLLQKAFKGKLFQGQ